MKDILKQLNSKIPLPLIIIILFIIAPLYIAFGCPILFFTGIPCMGCGMTRAALALLQFDFNLAFTMHPLIFMMPIAVLVLLFRKKIPKKIMQTLCVIGTILMVATYFYRLFTGSEVVCFTPENGFIYKIIHNIFI